MQPGSKPARSHALLALLNRDGEEARVVRRGGAQCAANVAVEEIDVATTAMPEEITRRVASAGLKAIPTGIEHGTVTVVIDGKPFEVTTLRQDVETYRPQAKVAFGRDWQADAERRDFTINALSAAADGTVYDYVGGIADIAARRVRFIGEPAKRIAEDYLRILRFFRFHAWYGAGALDAAGLHACIVARSGLETLSRERVRMELLKLLLAPHATPMLAIMAETGILGTVLGGVPLLASFENMAKVEAAAGLEADAVRRLGALGVTVSEDAERLAQRLRLANAETERLAALDRWWRISPACRRPGGACAALSSRTAIFRRSRDDRLVALRRGCEQRRMARTGGFAAALVGTRFSAEGRGFHSSRHCGRTGFGRGVARGGGGVDRCGFSGR